MIEYLKKKLITYIIIFNHESHNSMSRVRSMLKNWSFLWWPLSLFAMIWCFFQCNILSSLSTRIVLIQNFGLFPTFHNGLSLLLVLMGQLLPHTRSIHTRSIETTQTLTEKPTTKWSNRIPGKKGRSLANLGFQAINKY